MPGMLFAASHVKNDLPWEMNSFIAENPGIEVRLGRDLGDRRQAAARRRRPHRRGGAPAECRAARRLLVVVGRGTNDPDANSNIAKIARMLWEGMGFGWAEIAFSGVAHPRVDAALDRAARLGFRRIVVFPVFPVHRRAGEAHLCRRPTRSPLRFPEIEFVKAPYLRDHPLRARRLLSTASARSATGNPAMNCQLCKYRTQIVGYEDEAGAPQAGHHHHVRGIGTDDHRHA